MEPEDLYADIKNWNNTNGLMISAPASNKKQALEVTNKLMKKSLDKDLK